MGQYGGFIRLTFRDEIFIFGDKWESFVLIGVTLVLQWRIKLFVTHSNQQHTHLWLAYSLEVQEYMTW